jgi:hypothetical protein
LVFDPQGTILRGHEKPGSFRRFHRLGHPVHRLQKTRTAASAASPAADSASLSDRLKAVQSGKETDPQAALPNWKPFPSSDTAVPIPLQPGLEILTVDPNRAKDHPNEAPLSALIVAVNSSQVLVHHHNNPQADKERHAGNLQRKACLASHRLKWTTANPSATLLWTAPTSPPRIISATMFAKHKSEHFPDTEPLGVSTEVLNQLRAGQQADFHFIPDSEATASIGQVMQGMGKSTDLPPLTKHAGLLMFSCTLHRVESFDLAFPVQLNDQQVQLPALHAMCSFPDKTEGHIYLLDQPDNPILLWKNIGVLPETLQVVRIKLSR